MCEKLTSSVFIRCPTPIQIPHGTPLRPFAGALLVALCVLLPPAVLAASPGPVSSGPDYDAGLAALKAKDAPTAITAFTTCLQKLPADDACRWQLGWAYWTKNDWKDVVATWEPLAARNPTYETVQKDLASARTQLANASAATTARASAPATLPGDKPTIRIRAVGDMMIGSAFPAGALSPDDAVGTFDTVRSTLQDADITFGNLEGPLCDDETPSTKCKPDAAPGSCYAFRSPTRYGPLYKAAGFDLLNTANNHNGDFGEVCRQQTEATLAAQGILTSGRPGSSAEWTVNGKKIAEIGFHTNMACNYLNDTAGAVALVKTLVAKDDIVIVSFHGGAEGSGAQHVPVGHEMFYGEDRGDLRTFTHAVIDAGADLVLGHGPHVIRGMEVYKGRLIEYSMGNFATYGRFNLSGPQGVGEILEVGLGDDGRFVGGRIIGTVQEGRGRPALDPQNQAADLVRMLTAADFPELGPKVAQDGTFR